MPNGQEYSLEEALSQSADETVRKAAKVANKVLNIAGTINLLQELQAVDRAVPISSVLDSAQLLSLRKRVNAKGHQVASAGAGQMAYTLHFMVDADEKPAALFKTMDSEEMREIMDDIEITFVQCRAFRKDPRLFRPPNGVTPERMG
mmetsp:Transcript_72524/g.170558  ORF Transcript_72524/g.170558 Transcript_72524/m.170558 type:complete len:147 (+) Transcript_72524:480-920(+)